MNTTAILTLIGDLTNQITVQNQTIEQLELKIKQLENKDLNGDSSRKTTS